MRDRLLLAAVVMLIATLVCRAQTPAASAGAQGTQTTSPDKADQAALDVVKKVCTECHDLDQINVMRRTREGWLEIFDKMAETGAGGTDAECVTILAYLLRHRGLVNVNAAPKDDLVAVLSVPAETAEAIVAYRAAHGAFADFDAVCNVPGVDRKVLESVRAAIAFSSAEPL
jgi:competence ComEA-like helix-hairpin-helix protein